MCPPSPGRIEMNWINIDQDPHPKTRFFVNPGIIFRKSAQRVQEELNWTLLSHVTMLFYNLLNRYWFQFTTLIRTLWLHISYSQLTFPLLFNKWGSTAWVKTKARIQENTVIIQIIRLLSLDYSLIKPRFSI